jgi:hypothetical protein
MLRKRKTAARPRPSLLLAFLHDQRARRGGKRLGTEYGKARREALASASTEFAKSEHENRRI